jgi:hypothetical protein
MKRITQLEDMLKEQIDKNAILAADNVYPPLYHCVIILLYRYTAICCTPSSTSHIATS